MDLFDFDFSKEEDKQDEVNKLNSGYKLIFFDTETTGAKSDDQIIEIGSIVEDSEGNYEQYEELCATSNGKLIHPEAMVTHGIRNEDLKGCKNFQESSFYKDLAKLNNPANYLIAHNLPFDLARLEYYGFNSNLKHIDTLQCAKHLFELGESLGEYEYELPNYKLQTFRYILFSKKDEIYEAKKYDVKLDAHRAIGDVVVLKMFFQKLLKRTNLEGVEALDKLVELSAKPVLVKKFNFGKYKGRLIKDVYIQDPGYIEWLYKDISKQKKSGEKIDKNLYETLKEVIGK